LGGSNPNAVLLEVDSKLLRDPIRSNPDVPVCSTKSKPTWSIASGRFSTSVVHYREILSFSRGGQAMSYGPGGPMFGGGGGYFQPQGPHGPWMGCGCSSIFMILAGILLVMGGCLRMFGQ
jgi:hypothetical protein